MFVCSAPPFSFWAIKMELTLTIVVLGQPSSKENCWLELYDALHRVRIAVILQQHCVVCPCHPASIAEKPKLFSYPMAGCNLSHSLEMLVLKLVR